MNGEWTARLLLAAAMAFTAAPPGLADESVITGDVVYRERMLLPAGAEATVRLEETSSAFVITEVTVRARSSPTPFTLPYPASAIEEGGDYALRASISAGGELMFTSAEPLAFDGTVVEGIELLVQRTTGEDAAAAIVGSWLAEDIGGGGVIDDVQSTLTIAADGTVTGHGGCNGFGGSATIEDDKIAFGPMAGTLMACAEAIMNQERKFHDALSRTASFAIDDAGKLVLFDEGGAELARFSAS